MFSYIWVLRLALHFSQFSLLFPCHSLTRSRTYWTIQPWHDAVLRSLCKYRLMLPGQLQCTGHLRCFYESFLKAFKSSTKGPQFHCKKCWSKEEQGGNGGWEIRGEFILISLTKTALLEARLLLKACTGQKKMNYVLYFKTKKTGFPRTVLGWELGILPIPSHN